MNALDGILLAYDLGKLFGVAGDRPVANPFISGTLLADSFIDGYEDGLKQRDEHIRALGASRLQKVVQGVG